MPEPWRPGSDSRCRRPSPWCCSDTASTRSAMPPAPAGCTASKSRRSQSSPRRCSAWRARLHPIARAQRSRSPPPSSPSPRRRRGGRSVRSRSAASAGRSARAVAPAALPLRVSRALGALLLTAFFALLIGLPLLAAAIPSQALKDFDAFYRAGSLVFGGGHVVLPLLQASVVPPGWVGNDAFLAGYGAAQAVPGPL